jgi:hypothetical protein
MKWVTVYIVGLPHPLPEEVANALGYKENTTILTLDECARIVTILSSHVRTLRCNEPQE